MILSPEHMTFSHSFSHTVSKKNNMEPKNWWFVDVYEFPRVYFQVPI